MSQSRSNIPSAFIRVNVAMQIKMRAYCRHTLGGNTGGLLIVILILLLVTLGCDPGMTIYQTNLGQSAETVPQRITIQINTTQQLIGEKIYSPGATVTDLADKPIIIDKVELIAD